MTGANSHDSCEMARYLKRADGYFALAEALAATGMITSL